MPRRMRESNMKDPPSEELIREGTEIARELEGLKKKAARINLVRSFNAIDGAITVLMKEVKFKISNINSEGE